MFAKLRIVVPLAAAFFLLSAPLVSADDGKKPGFHGWGDQLEVAPEREAASEKKAVEDQQKPVKETRTPEKEARKAEAKQPKAEKSRKADSKPKDPVREKVRSERKAFFEDTKSLRQEIYQKRLELRSELAKKKPSARRAKAIQKDIAKMRTKLDGQRLEHFLELKKIDPDMGWRKFRGKKGYGGCPGCPYQGRGYGDDDYRMGPGYGGGHHMMGPGYGRHHMWDEDDELKPRRGEGNTGRQEKKSAYEPSSKTGDLSESDAIGIVRDFLKSTRDLNLKIGGLSDAGDAYMVEILTRTGSVFDRVLVDKQNGHMRPVH